MAAAEMLRVLELRGVSLFVMPDLKFLAVDQLVHLVDTLSTPSPAAVT